MKKLQELTRDELKSLYGKNTEFRLAIDQFVYDENGLLSQDRYNEYFEKDARGFKYNDHYTSFYYTLTEAEEFVGSVKKTARDYFEEEAQKHFDKMFDLYEKWENMAWEEQDENEKVYLDLEAEAEYILKCIEDDLKSFEEITDDEVESVLDLIIDGVYMSDWETDGEKVYWEETHILK